MIGHSDGLGRGIIQFRGKGCIVMMRKKRLTALLLSAALCLALCACGTRQEEEVSSTQSAPESETSSIITEYFDGVSTYSIDAQEILASVEEGTFTAKDTNGDPVEITLGMTETPIRRAFEENGELFGSEGDTYIRFYTGYTQMYIPKDDPSQGIIAIVHSDTAYGFEINITNRESILAVLGEPATEGPATAEQAEVLIDPNIEAHRMVYEAGDNRLEFFLVNNLLAATSISNRELWQR